MRALTGEETETARNTLSSFSSDVIKIRDLTRLIEDYAESNETKDVERARTKKAKLEDQIKEKRKELKASQPELEELRKALEDQERHKKTINDNLDLVRSQQQWENLDKEIARLIEEKAKVTGAEHAEAEYGRISEQKQQRNAQKDRLEGRRGEMLEQIRTLKVSRMFTMTSNHSSKLTRTFPSFR